MFSTNLKELRKESNITQSALAEMLNVHLQTVSKWERGLSQPDISVLGEMAHVLGVTLERLLEEDDAEKVYTGVFDAVSFGKNLSELRRRAGEHQEDVARIAQATPDAVSKWERGVICPDIEQLRELAHHYGVGVSRLYFAIGEDTATETPVQLRRRKRLSLAWLGGAAILGGAAVACAVLLPLSSMSGGNVYVVMADGVSYEVNEHDWFTPAPSEKAGYDFVGYADESGQLVEFPTKIAGNTQYTAVFEPHAYTIEYWLNGGYFTGTPRTSFDLECGEVELLRPYKQDAVFEGWYTSADLSGEAVESVSCCASDIVLYAAWSDDSYTVEYELCGGTLHGSNPSSVTKDEAVALASPVREGYLFLGWYDSEAGGKRYESVGGEDARNITLYALWQKSDAIFSIEYDYGEGAPLGENPTAVRAGEVHELFGASKTGHDFLGWNTQKDGKGEYVEYLYGIDRSLVLYAIYSPKEYVVQYIHDGSYPSEARNPNYITYGERVTLLDVYLYGYTFLGWYDSERGGERVETIDEDNILTISVLYARFEPLRAAIVFDAGEGTIVGTQLHSFTDIAVYGEAFAMPSCTRGGYVFLGWFNEDGEKVESVGALNFGDMRLTARWRQNDASYTIEYITEGGTLPASNPTKVLCGQELPLDAPERSGYLFLGWYTDPYGNGTRYDRTPADREEDLVLYAVWQEIVTNGSSEYFDYEIVAGRTVTIAGYRGEAGANIAIQVPALIESLPVTQIEGSFFGYAAQVRSVTLPEGLLRIGEGVFSLMTIEERLTIPASVIELGARCFTGCDAEVVFAEGSAIASIGQNAFFNAKLRNVLVLPQSVTTLEGSAFSGANVPGIVLPDGLQTIGPSALMLDGKQEELPSIYIPASVSKVVGTAIAAKTIYVGGEQAIGGDNVVRLAGEYRVNLQDGDGEEVLVGNAFALPCPTKAGHTFLGWKDEAGRFVDRLFIPTEDCTLTAFYEEASAQDGRSARTPMTISLGEEVVFYAFDGEGLYFSIDTQGEATVLVDMTVSQGALAFYRYDNAMGEYVRDNDFDGYFTCRAGERYMVGFCGSCPSRLVRLQMTIASP